MVVLGLLVLSVVGVVGFAGTRSFAYRRFRGYMRSMMVTLAIPPPSHMVCSP